ncbi:hypothetical protein AA11826_2146 [Komagataeibacter oboediens DSM 11826]|uniref:Uncharacterized protein n=2 Tax=Komagataeibacter TaxID=1434011 RepID=A0A0C1VEX9_9PROT|nr:hypothetical protein GLUCOINTEAF2_0204184 [Komagataeibacter intermedius AF2]KPH87368.1 hypothetical protein GLUCOINTEAF2_0204111 [Komagataeibacter intermedius AF2]GBQ05104.1 hypothetical protein AA11826_2146 [Komagataeibacter oboediens DSM 11826]
MEDETESRILNEAAGAHTTSRRILDLMEQKGEDDPLKLMIRLLTEIRETQRGILLKLSTLEKRLQRLEERHD